MNEMNEIKEEKMKEKQVQLEFHELFNKDTLEELKALKSWWDSIGFNTKTDLKLSLDPNKIKEQIGGGSLEVGQTFGGRQQTKHYIKDNTTKEVYKNIQSITVGFYAENFFSKYGFKIDKKYGGMVRHL